MGENRIEAIIAAIREGREPGAMEPVYLSLAADERKTLLAALRTLTTREAGEFLRLVYPKEEDKAARKEMKRLLFRLKSAGVDVGEPEEGGESALKSVAEIRHHRGFMSTYDPELTRVVLVAFEVKRNLFAFFHGILSLTGGLLELATATMKVKDLETIIADYRVYSKKPMAFVEISPKYAAFLLDEAAQTSGRHVEDVRQVRQFSLQLKDFPGSPADVYSLPTGADTEPLPPEKIFGGEIFSSLCPAWESMEADRKAYQELGTSGILLPSHMTQEKRMAFVEALAEHTDISSMIAPMKRLTEDYAYLFHLLGQPGTVKGLLAGLGTETFPREVLLFFVKRELDRVEEKPPDPRLIVNPYEQVRR